MATTLTVLAGLAALIALPVIVLLWATESRAQRARRWRRAGLSYRAMGPAYPSRTPPLAGTASPNHHSPGRVALSA